MYEIQMTKNFRKDVELCKKRGYDMELLKTVIRLLDKTDACPQVTVHTNCLETMLVVGNAI